MVTNNSTNNLRGTTITGTANQITVTNGDGVAGAPTLSLPTTMGNLANSTRTVFTATLSGALTNQTGDGTVVDIVFDTVTQQGTAYATGTGLFTAPQTGYYLFGCQIALTSIGAGHTSAECNLNINGTTGVVVNVYNPVSVYNSTLGYVSYAGSKILSLTSGDTVRVRVKVSNSTKTVGISATNTNTNFTGYFLC